MMGTTEAPMLADIEAARLRACHKGLAVLPQLLQAPRLAAHHFDGRACCRRDGRAAADAVDEARRGVFQQLDQLAAAGDIAPGRSQRLAERAHPDIDIGGIDALLFGDAAAGGAPARPPNALRRPSSHAS